MLRQFLWCCGVAAASGARAGVTRYEMLTCYLGKGDKETFAYGMMAVGEPFSLVLTPPRRWVQQVLPHGFGACTSRHQHMQCADAVAGVHVWFKAFGKSVQH